MSMFARNLRNRIKALKLTEVQVARACGLSARRFSHYVNDTREPDLSTIIAIASVLNTSPDELLLGNGSGSRLPKDHVLARLEYVVRQLSCEDIEIIVVQAKALMQCRQRQAEHIVKCSEVKKVACFKRFKNDPRKPAACACYKNIT